MYRPMRFFVALRGWCCALVCCWLFLATSQAPLHAGGGPENVLLVVNRRSTNSLTIANHYQQLRQIPPGNVLTLAWDPKVEATDVATFRKEILLPILRAIEQRRLGPQIDYVVYSSDFPTMIDIDGDVKSFYEAGANFEQPAWSLKLDPKAEWPKPLTKVASITGLTYLWQPAAVGNPAYVDLRANVYAREGDSSLGFSSSMNFGPKGEVLPPGAMGRRFLLSVMLGVTAGRGNSLQEVIDYLQRSTAADGTFPRGTIYYCENDNIRSRARDAGFPTAVRQLKALGVEAELIRGVLPLKKDDVQGAMVGAESFQWETSGSKILPGAICEHFTSFGGDLRASAGQTPLSEWLRHGAAGSSGTVTEPFAIKDKFPLPCIHVHYARGCTLAEAFYQSVAGPYQLLIVGDPLCRPWANIPLVSVSGVRRRAIVRGVITLKASAQFPKDSAVDRFELFVDELRYAVCKPDQPIVLDTAALADGYHELRVVAVEAGPIATRGRAVLPVFTANHGRSIELSVDPRSKVSEDAVLAIAANSPGSSEIVVMQDCRLLGKIPGERGKLEIPAAALGLGPARIRAVGVVEGKPQQYVWAEPVTVEVSQAQAASKKASSASGSQP